MRELSGEFGPLVEAQLTLFPAGGAMLDVRRNGRAFVMAYSPAHGFGVDELYPGEGLSNHYRFTSTDFDSAAKRLRELSQSEPGTTGASLSLLVIQAKNVEAAKDFYTLLGLEFAAEQHGTGPHHYAATLGPLVLEIYPCKADSPRAPLRLGFDVPALEGTLNLLRRRGAKIISEPKDSPWGRRAVVEDPDGNRVELTAPA
jgi:hypothetical protein